MYFLLILSVIFNRYSCVIKNEQTDEPAVRISRLFPLVGATGHVAQYYPVETKIWYSGDQICYESSYQHSDTVHDFETDPVYKQVFYSFTYTKGKKYGLYLDTARKIAYKEVSVDSMLKKEWAVQKDFGMWFDKTLIKLELLNAIQNTDSAEDYYSFRNLKDTTMTGTLTLGYSKELLRIKEYSLSAMLDSLKQMKLCSVQMHYNARTVGGTDFHMDVMDIPYKLEEIKNGPASFVQRLFTTEKRHRYKR